MSLENEAKIDKVMERVTGINCRRGLGMQSEDIASGLSYGYGFYWTCCNDICAKARVMGNLGGVMEVTVKGPVGVFFPFRLDWIAFSMFLRRRLSLRKLG